jgi:hypothetical protein
MCLKATNPERIATQRQGRELGNIHVNHIVLLAKLLFYNRLITILKRGN